jgi:hypothetical protein
MARVIRKLVEDDEDPPTTPQDEVVTVRLGTREQAKNTSVWRVVVGLQDILHTPGGPEMLHGKAPCSSTMNSFSAISQRTSSSGRNRKAGAAFSPSRRMVAGLH